jgi:hypothetical protein
MPEKSANFLFVFAAYGSHLLLCIFSLDDSFDKFLQKTAAVSVSTRTAAVPADAAVSHDDSKTTTGKSKPAISAKPRLSSSSSTTDSGNTTKPALPPKPKTKPSASTTATTSSDAAKRTSAGGANVLSAQLNANDIMKYIEQNSRADDDEPDLFA